jgi:outer membrane protein TolC
MHDVITMKKAARLQPGKKHLHYAALAFVMISAAGCALTPEPITPEERAALVSADRKHLFENQEPVTGPISLEEAIARAIKYNYDYRLTAMDQALQNRQLDLSRYDMLPKLVASAGGTARSSENLTVSENSKGVRSTEPSLSQDQERATADLTMSWNVLDFGVSYYQARQQADRTLIAGERRRRVVHSVAQQVRSAYWQAVSGERIQAAIAPVLEEARRTLADARAVEQQRLRPPLEVLRYQKAVIEIMRQLEAVEQDLAIAKAQLRALMNLQPGQPFTLALPQGFKRDVPPVKLTLEEMEAAALTNRPELREEQYQQRISSAEVRKAILRLLPGLTFTGGGNYDSNSYVQNNFWAEAGLRVSWNLLTLLSGPAAVAAAEAQQDLGETRRLALSMATLTQVHVGYQQYQRARRNFEQADLLNSIEQRIFDNTRNAEAGEAQNVLERVRAAASAISSELSRDRAYAEVQAATANLMVSLGLDPLPAEVPGHDIKALSAAFGAMNATWQSGEWMPPAPVPTPAPVPVAAPVPTPAPASAAPIVLAPAPAAVPVAVEPVEPVTPVAKVEPVQTEAPVAKVEAIQPTAPVAKVEAVKPAAPVAKVEPVQTETPVARVEPVAVETPAAGIVPVSMEQAPSDPVPTSRKSNPNRKPLISNFR